MLKKLIARARAATALQEQLSILQEIIAYAMLTGPRGGRFYYTPSGKKIYRELGGKSKKPRKTRKVAGAEYYTAWKDRIKGGFGDQTAKGLKELFGDKAPTPEELEKMYSGLGVSARLKYSRITDRGSVSLGFEVRDENGAAVGTMDREIFRAPSGALTIKHDYMVLREKERGKGIGAAAFSGALKEYKKLGIEKIRISAGLTVGPYVWAKYGFESDPDELEFFQDEFAEYLEKQGVSSSEAKKLAAERCKSIYDLASTKLTVNRGGKKTTTDVGKRYLIDESGGWDGELRVGDSKAASRWNRQVKKGLEKRKAYLKRRKSPSLGQMLGVTS